MEGKKEGRQKTRLPSLQARTDGETRHGGGSKHVWPQDMRTPSGGEAGWEQGSADSGSPGQGPRCAGGLGPSEQLSLPAWDGREEPPCPGSGGKHITARGGPASRPLYAFLKTQAALAVLRCHRGSGPLMTW